MAGICGIISLSDKNISSIPIALNCMLNTLAINERQHRSAIVDEYFGFGNVSLIHDTHNSNCIFNKEFNTFTIIDGLVFINENKRDKIINLYSLSSNSKDKELIPYLYSYYGADFLNFINGNYNIFIYNKTDKNGLLFNSHLGFLPLFYYQSDDLFVYASKIEAILASMLLPKIEFDQCSILEQLVFNYVISDNTSIQNIKVLKNATSIAFNNLKITKSSYWKLSALFQQNQESETKSFELINEGLRNSISKVLTSNTTINTSLTGGWDSRLILSYLEKAKNQIQLFSFGAYNSPDIEIPKQIAKKERFKYTPIILDDCYLESKFVEEAKSTITRSNGTRNFKRTHYIYSVENISEESDIFLSGIFGDEMFKIAKVSPCGVISKYAIELIANDFNPESILNKIKIDQSLSFITINSQVLEQFGKRLADINTDVSHLSSIQEKYYYFRLLINLPKYFGAEANSYNDYCQNFSPFIDVDFLKNYFKSSYCGLFYSFNSKAFKLKKQTAKLYTKLISTNYPKLSYFNTDRGYSIQDTTTFIGRIKIAKILFFKNKSRFDSYNTEKTTLIFLNYLDEIHNFHDSSIFINSHIIKKSSNAELISLYYWIKFISDKYIKV